MKEKIVYMTDMNLKTGFGIVAHNVCNGLAEAGYEVFYIGWGFKADSGFRRGNYTLLPIGNGPFGEDVLAMYLQQLKAEVLVVQADTRMIQYVPNVLKQIPNKPTWILYPVIDGCVWDYENQRTKWPSNWTATIKQADKVVAMTDYGKNILKANGVESTRIYHGVDTSLYRPVSEEVRAQIKINTGIGKDTFIFGGIFKNMQRKNPEKYLQAFKILLESKHLSKEERNKLVLLLHTNPQPMGGGEFDLVQQAIDYGLELGKNVVFSNMQLPPENMPLIFQVMNAYLQLGGMEGFCGKPETKIITSTKVKHISDIKEGELVLTHKANFKKVIKGFKRKYKGKMIGIKRWKNSEKIWLTPNHPVMTIQTEKCKTSNTSCVAEFCIKKENCTLYKNIKSIEDYPTKWESAKNLKEWNLVTFPRLQSHNSLKSVKISNFSSVKNMIPKNGKLYTTAINATYINNKTIILQDCFLYRRRQTNHRLLHLLRHRLLLAHYRLLYYLNPILPERRKTSIIFLPMSCAYNEAVRPHKVFFATFETAAK
mgnify:CR=1 FL=1